MIEAFNKEDYETFDTISEYRDERFKHLLRIEADLVYYGHFTRADVSTMKPVEYRYHIAEINRRAEEKQKALKRH